MWVMLIANKWFVAGLVNVGSGGGMVCSAKSRVGRWSPPMQILTLATLSRNIKNNQTPSTVSTTSYAK